MWFCRKVFFDALFRTGTGEAVEVVVQLLKSKELSEMEQKLVYLSLAFIRHATKGSLASAAVSSISKILINHLLKHCF